MSTRDLSGYQIRSMLHEDCEEALSLSNLIGWGYTYDDWLEGLQCSEDSAFVVTNPQDLMVGVGLGMSFPTKARLANIIVHPLYRGRGIGTLIVSDLVDRLHEMGHTYIDLEASYLGYSIYSGLGFKSSYKVTTWQKRITRVPGQIKRNQDYIFTTDDVQGTEAIDARAFGASRLTLIQNFTCNQKNVILDKAKGKTNGFVVCSKLTNGMGIGPWVHENAAGAENLLSQALSYLSTQPGLGKIYVHTIDRNPVAKDLLIKNDFHPILESDHMYLSQGKEQEKQGDIYYGLWGLAEG